MKVCVRSGGKIADFIVGCAPVSWEGWLLAQPWQLCIKAIQSPLWIRKGGIQGRAGLRLHCHQD